MKQAIFVRHVQRVKGDSEQNLTFTGKIIALVMGLVFKQYKDGPYDHIVTSPQLRGYRTALHFLVAQQADGSETRVAILEDHRLNDFSSDQRPAIAEPLQAAKKLEKQTGFEVEGAMYLVPGGPEALTIKVDEAIDCIQETLQNSPGSGCCLFCGLHGGMIDDLYWRLAVQLNDDLTRGPGCAGGLFAHGEGFIVNFYDDGSVQDIKIIRQPPYLKALLVTLNK